MLSVVSSVVPLLAALQVLQAAPAAPKPALQAAPAPPKPVAPADPRSVVLGALKTELQRAKERLRMPKEDPPYFLRYLVRDYDETDMGARFGAIVEDDHTRARQANVEARVGDYQFDNTADDSTDKMFDIDDFDRYEPPVAAPLDDDIDALRATLWLQTDVKYKRALSLLHKKRGARVTNVVEDESVASFSKEQPARSIDSPVTVNVDRAAWRDRLRKVSAAFKAYPEIFDSQVKLNVSHQTRYLVSTEGTELISERLIWALHFSASGRAADGLLVPHYRSFYGASEGELPDEKAQIAAARQLSEEIRKLREAPMMDPYNGPAILLPEAAGVFFHEALGHRLEGERQNDSKEGATFKGQIGRPILPGFLTILDDPTMRKIGSVSLNGYYRYRRRGRDRPPGDPGGTGGAAQLPEEPDAGEGIAELERPRPRGCHAGPHRPHGQHHRPIRSPRPLRQAEADAAGGDPATAQGLRADHRRHQRRADQHHHLRLPGVQGHAAHRVQGGRRPPGRRRWCAGWSSWARPSGR